MIDTAQIIYIAATTVLTTMLVYVSFALRSFKVSVERLETALDLLTGHATDLGQRVVRLETQLENLKAQ